MDHDTSKIYVLGAALNNQMNDILKLPEGERHKNRGITEVTTDGSNSWTILVFYNGPAEPKGFAQ